MFGNAKSFLVPKTTGTGLELDRTAFEQSLPKNVQKVCATRINIQLIISFIKLSNSLSYLKCLLGHSLRIDLT